MKNCINVSIYDEETKNIVIECYEETQYYEGEVFTPLDDKVDYFVMFASNVQNNKQVVIAKKVKL